MTLKFKVIKPSSLNPALFKAAIVDAANEMTKQVHRDFDEEISFFRHGVTFDESVSENSNGVTASVLTADLGFKYYDQGNGGPDRVIRPVRAKALHWIDKGGADVFRKSVHGYDGRHAVDKIEKMWAEKAPVLFTLYVSSAAKESGHAL